MSFDLAQLPRAVAASAACLAQLLPWHASALKSLRLEWEGAGCPVDDALLCGGGGAAAAKGGWRSLETLSLRGCVQCFFASPSRFLVQTRFPLAHRCGGGAGWGLCDRGLQRLLEFTDPLLIRELDLTDCSGLASLEHLFSGT